MQRISILFIFMLLVVSDLFSAPGDTTKVRSHNAAHLNWYGNFDRWAAFPTAPVKYERVWLTYTMGCPSGGCSDWDYTTRVIIRQRTGKIDSVLDKAPSFRVDGQIVDSVIYKSSLTFTYSWNAMNRRTDTLANQQITILIFGDTTRPTVATDTLRVWKAGYWNYIFDNAGQKTDSVFVTGTTLNVTYTNYFRKFEVIENYEVARVITPYGGNLANSWKFPYRFDITDFVSLLRDSVEIRVLYEGWSDGFTATLDFDFIEGTPPREAFKVTNLWNGGFPYGDVNNPEDSFLTAKQLTIDNNAKSAKLRILQTGHGFGGNENCAEFCQKSHYIKIDGTQEFKGLIWRNDCGLNPLYPQAGTWLYDRANWCPGSASKPFEYELMPLVSAGQRIELDVDMQYFVNVSNNNCSYGFGSALISYGANSFAKDACLEDILSPTNYLPHGRSNPICRNPVVRIKNNGSETLTNLVIKYGVVGGVEQIFNWTGSLKFLQTADVELGIIDWASSSGGNIFEVKVEKPNGQTDEYQHNNTLRSTFVNPPMYPSEFYIQLRTNNAGGETSYFIWDGAGNVIFTKNGLAANTTFRDTFRLADGCYQFEIKDSGKDGLSFFANQDGTGSLRFATLVNNNTIKQFDANFGTSIIHNFTVGGLVSTENLTVTEPTIYVYPNPAQREFTIDIAELGVEEVEIEVFSVTGQRVYLNKIIGNNMNINVVGLESGLYFVKVLSGDRRYYKKVIILE